MRILIAVCVLIFFATLGVGQEKKAVELNQIRLYLTDEVFSERVGGDVTALTNYIKALQKESAIFWEKVEQPNAKGLLIAVGVKPGNKAKVWCDFIDGKIPKDMIAKLEKKLTEVPAIAVKKPIAFGLELKLWGQTPDKFPVFPQAWVEVSKDPLMIPDELFPVIWPD